MLTDKNRRCTIDRDELEVSIKLKTEELTWKEIMLELIDCLRGLGFSSKQLDEYYENIMDES